MKRNKRWWALALPLVLQLGIGDVAYAEDLEIVDETVNVSTPRGVSFVVGGQRVEVGKISNPHVRVALEDFNPNLVGVSVERYAAGGNPDFQAAGTTCSANHNLEDGTANMTVVADLEAGAEGTLNILVEYTETHPNNEVHTHTAASASEPIEGVGPAGQMERIPICIHK